MKEGIYRLNGGVGIKDENGNSEIIKVSRCGHRHRSIENARKCLLVRIKAAKGLSLTLCGDEEK